MKHTFKKKIIIIKGLTEDSKIGDAQASITFSQKNFSGPGYMRRRNKTNCRPVLQQLRHGTSASSSRYFQCGAPDPLTERWPPS